jgi:ankyrin repeat protein
LSDLATVLPLGGVMFSVTSGRQASLAVVTTLSLLLVGCGSTPAQKTVRVRELLMNNNGEEAANLLNAGADPFDTDAQGVTLLHLAAARGLHPAATALVAKGVDVNARTKEGLTPLYEAVSGGKEEIVGLLLRCQADPNITPPGKPSALMVAKQNGFSKIAQLLQSKQAK